MDRVSLSVAAPLTSRSGREGGANATVRGGAARAGPPGCAPAPQRAAWGADPGPPGPAMARPQRTPARSPDSIVEVKSKVRASPVPAPAPALGASNSLILPFLASWSYHLFPSSILHAPFSGFSFRCPSPVLFSFTAGLQSPSVARVTWRAGRRPWTASLVLELRSGLKATAVAAALFPTSDTLGPVVRKDSGSVPTPPLSPLSASSLMPSSDDSPCPALR